MNRYSDRARLERYARWMINHQSLSQRRAILDDHDRLYGVELTDDLREQIKVQFERLSLMTEIEKQKLALADNRAQMEALAS